MTEEALEAMAQAQSATSADAELVDRPLYKQWNCIFGFVAQFCYVGAQVTVASFFINYLNENAELAKSRASFLLSMALLIFTIGRFVGTALLSIFSSDFLLMIYACACIALCAACSAVKGQAATGCIMGMSLPKKNSSDLTD